MAVNATPVDASLRLVLEVGTDAQGNPILRARTYNRVKPTAADQALYDAALALAGLQVHPLHFVHRVNENALAQV